MIQWARLDLEIVRYASWPSGTWSLKDRVTGEVIPIAGKVIQYGIRLHETTADLLLISSSTSSGNRIVKDGDSFYPVIAQATLQGLPPGQHDDEPAVFFNYLKITHEDGVTEVYGRGRLTVHG